MVHIPTRADKILDLFLTTNESQVTKIDTLPDIGGSDHSIVRILTNVIPVRKKQPKREIFLYSKADMSSLRKDLTSFGESFVDKINSHSVQQNWTTIKDTISDLMTKYIPKKNATTRHNLPWFDTKLRRMNRKLQRLYNRQRKTKSPDDEKKFKDYRANYKKALRRAQMSYIHDTMGENLHSNTKAFWKIVKSKREDKTGIPPLKDGDQTTDNSLEKANIWTLTSSRCTPKRIMKTCRK